MTINNTSDYVVSVQYMFTRMMVRYDKLNELIPKAFKGYTDRELNIFIDLYSIYRTMYSRSFRTDVKDFREFTVYLIDLCTHYRSYFNYLGISTKIFIISSYNIPDHITLPGYNKNMHDKLKNKPVSEMVTVNIELLKILCPYLPDIHFLETKHESTVLMYELLLRGESCRPSMILSTDIYPIQLTTLFDNVAYLYPIKDFGSDDSWIIYPKTHSHAKFTLWPMIMRKTHKIIREQTLMSLSTRNVVLLESLNSVSERNITPALVSLSSIAKYIHDIIGEEDILLQPEFLTDIQRVYKDNKSNDGLKGDERRDYLKNIIPQVRERYNALNVIYQYEYYRNSVEQMTLHYNNLSDPQAVQIINDKYFSDNPIDLLRL
jgi:hypothetical protein